jgi:6-pyruvoyltetrahydropterin/6-carboxytetrahydropterin synthase
MESFGIRIYKEYFNFAAAHFLIFEDGTREELHGHNYLVEMQVEGTLGEENDVFIDFLHIKPIVKAVCDSIDHRTLLPERNLQLKVEKNENQVTARFGDKDTWSFPARDVVILPIPNTSAERLAQYLCNRVLKDLSEKYPNAIITKVEFTVEESRGQAAIYKQEYDEPTPLKFLYWTKETAAI